MWDLWYARRELHNQMRRQNGRSLVIGGQPGAGDCQHRLGCSEEACMTGHTAQCRGVFVVHFALQWPVAPWIELRRGNLCPLDRMARTVLRPPSQERAE